MASKPKPKPTPPTLSSIDLSEDSIATAQANGFDLTAHVASVRAKAADLIVGLRAFAAALPLGDANAEIVAGLIAALA